MTFVVKTRGAGGPFMAEYECPEHGRFERLVERDEKGDPPAVAPCPCPGSLLHIAEALGMVEPGAYEEVPCGRPATWSISAPKPRVLSAPATAVTRGGDLKDRPPGMLDTRPLAEGMPMSEWRKVQKKHSEERRHQQLIERGLKTRKVQV